MQYSESADYSIKQMLSTVESTNVLSTGPLRQQETVSSVGCLNFTGEITESTRADHLGMEDNHWSGGAGKQL